MRTPRVIAIDWSGAAAGAEKKIWLAEVAGGTVVRLECGRRRDEIAVHLIDEAGRHEGMIVGLDFAFSMPAWFFGEHGIASAAELWALAGREGDRWLAACEAPFWGRPGRPRPAASKPQFRHTEVECHAAKGVLPKSVFQIGGRGAVGTGSLRGMPVLLRLHEAAFSIWPFDAYAGPRVVEIYPRVFTGPVVKASAAARDAYLRVRCDGMREDLRAAAAASEDAFDAAVSALGMWAYVEELRTLPSVSDPLTLLEGAIWYPGCATARPPGAAP